jgi:hypothetical protein
MVGPYEDTTLMAAPEAEDWTSGIAPVVLSDAALPSLGNGFTMLAALCCHSQVPSAPHRSFRIAGIRESYSILIDKTSVSGQAFVRRKRKRQSQID